MWNDSDDSILKEAYRVTRESRELEYDSPMINFLRAAELWTAYCRHDLLRPGAWFTPIHIAWMMILFKVARSIKAGKRDNVVDTAGYADCIGRIDEYMISLGYQEGAETFRTMSYAQALDLIERIEHDQPVPTSGPPDLAGSSVASGFSKPDLLTGGLRSAVRAASYDAHLCRDGAAEEVSAR